ncbi:MAG: flagellar biosynthesis protein FlhF [Treponema sp. GWB1_62_6]|nr:MAG: flagellar biosynthesis protein FlhF [Treponema sp. GWC1_61_84]OHE65163.1 MAG: flagellar biosynthesis protein FlhF [Treponema sp. GWA1_62_8]OHE70475.1 MAG: flagellar biosynthesis protein FlhF [Treponema sp. RIFOXYC1_FULL_61_9]OHE72055.1 MAG: flagellar biosynthesis protein FlhF [Treponema sp. GWB1_62_6]HCM27962.1 flagellar biosynthesis protein FlhF [Treponema sp.]
MEYFTEQAPTYSECMRKIRTKYGEGARVLMQRSVRMGGMLGLFSRDGVEVSGVLGSDTGRFAADAARQVKKPLDVEEEKKKFLANLKGDQALQLVLNEVRGLKDKIDANAAAGARGAEEHPALSRVAELLNLNDFSSFFVQELQDRMKKEFSLEQLDDFDAVQDKVVDWIGESIKVYADDGFQIRPRVMVLVGPTGVGKTTTIAKLAAAYGIGSAGSRPLSVRMITIDNYRIAARQQIETYGNIMGIPVSCVETFDDLRKTIALYSQDVDLILIDTIGKSPRDYMKLAEMKELLTACGNSADVHLAISATTKSSDMREALQQFEPFNYRSVIVTKLDETIRVGNVVSALAEKGKSVSYITDGQRVPQDISRASTVRFLMNLEGFRVDRRRVDERFPQESNGKIQWR